MPFYSFFFPPYVYISITFITNYLQCVVVSILQVNASFIDYNCLPSYKGANTLTEIELSKAFINSELLSQLCKFAFTCLQGIITTSVL